MRAASRAAGRVLFATAVLVGLVATAPDAAAAQATPEPQCPAVVGELPLSITTPFSGTTRPVAGDGGEIASVSLLCAYGEGVEPSAEITATWEPRGDALVCGEATTVVAPSLRSQPFDQAADDLLAGVGTDCPSRAAAGVSTVALAAGGAAAVLVLSAVLVQRRRRRRPAPTPGAPEVVVEAPAEPEPEPAVVVVPEPEPAPAAPEPEPLVLLPPRPEPTPVLASLSGASGRAFARTGAGQWATVSAVAYAAGNVVIGDLARAGALQALEGHRPPRSDLAVLARTVAHQDRADGR